MKLAPALLVCLLLLSSCSVQEHIAARSAKLHDQYANLKTWDKLPVRTITWQQAVSMMKSNNLEYLRMQQAISKAERTETSVYTDLIPGVSYYGYFTKSLGNLTDTLHSDDFVHDINISFYLPTITQIPYRVYATQASTFGAIKALEAKERELISKLYLLQRTHALSMKEKALDERNPQQKPDYLLRNNDAEAKKWHEIASLLGDYSARWQILPSSIPNFQWSRYKEVAGRLDELTVCQFAMELEKVRLSQYNVALSYLPTVNASLYSPSLFSSTGGTYSGTFLDSEDTKLNMGVSYSLDTDLRNWNTYCDGKELYQLAKKETLGKMVELKHKLSSLHQSMTEYYAWKSFMHKRMEHLRNSPATTAEEFLETEKTLYDMEAELLTQEKSALESEAALIQQYGILQ